MVNIAVLVTPPALAEIVAEVFDFTEFVLTEKVADVLPAAIVTEAGTVTSVRLLESATAKPLEGAADVSVTVPTLALPCTTVVGLNVNDLSLGALIVKVADFELVPISAVTVDVVSVATAGVLIVNVAEVLLTGTVTVAGTDPYGEMDKVTGIPPAGAGPFRVMAPVAVAPPIRLVGLIVTDTRSGGEILSAFDSVASSRLALILAVY